jgi:PIN domain nuclease of toxin-antitoxin system
MKELLEQLKRATLPVDRAVLLDTCYLFYMAEHQKLSQIDELAKKRQVLISTFNAEELLLKSHHIADPIKDRLRHWLKQEPNIQLLTVNVHPGQWLEEKNFVKSINPGILARIPDASDAVLFAQALQNKCDVLTKDKHHLFTTLLENFAQHGGIRVEKDIHDL